MTMSTSDVIRTESLQRVFHMGQNQVAALRGINLRVERGEMIAIMGPSGSGKSTLMNLLGCLDQPTAGAYYLDGERVDGLSPNDLATVRNQKIGFVFQGFNLLPRTQAIDNVELPLLYDVRERHLDTHATAARALERVGLADRMHHESSELSGGQQQRVAIARALVTEPAIVLADEPTGNLDTRTSIEVLALFQQLNDSGITLLIVTHEPDIALYTKRIVELRDGHVVRDEPVRARRNAVEDLAAIPPEAAEV